MSEAARTLDAKARAHAQSEFARPLVVEAGAGTGKTAVLTARVVSWSLGPGWEHSAARRGQTAGDASPDAIARDVLGRIAAITFTEAAAAEMAIRIEDALHGVELGVCEPWLDEAALPPAEQRTLRARALREALDHLTVRTIHAWCRSLLARFPIAAGLHPDFEVDATGRIQAEALQRVLERQLRTDYSEDANGPLLELAELEQGPSRIYQAASALIDEGACAAEFEGDPLPAAGIDAMAGELRGAFAALAAYVSGSPKLARVPDEVFARVRQTLELLDQAGGELAEPGGLRGLDVFTTDVRAAWGERGNQLKLWARGKSLSRLCGTIAVDEDEFAAAAGRAHSALDVVCRLFPRRLAAGHRAFRTLLGAFEREMARRAAVTYAGLLRGARDLLVEHPAIAGQLRSELDLLLVDEFQDTDALQCDLVRALALVGPAAERPSLFVVGDPKQSIYGWRNADLAAYAEFVSAIEAEGGERLELSVNFRSVPSVLAEVERICAPVMIEEAGVQPRFEPLHACESLQDQPGFSGGEADDGEVWAPVEHWVSWQKAQGLQDPSDTTSPQASEIEARAFARDVARLRDERGVALKDIALLLRSRSDLESYLHALREADVAYVVAGERSYFERREVIDAISGLCCVLDSNDHVALLAFVRSATVGVPDAALIPLWAGEFPRLAGRLHPARPLVLEELATLVRTVAAHMPPDVPGIERIEGWEESLLAALAAIARLRESFEQDAPDRFVERLRMELAIETSEAGRFPAAFRVANLERFYRELALELAAGADEHALLRRLRTSAGSEREVDEPVMAVEDAVQVMTIHGAKGLGFEHVYLAQVHKEQRASSGAPDRIERVADRLEYRLLGTDSLGFAAALAQRERRDRAESVRTLYVALTRAKQRLVVMGARDDDGPRDFAGAKSMAKLLSHRVTPPLAARMAELVQSDLAYCDEADARWRFPALERDGNGPERGKRSLAEWPTAERARAIWQPVVDARAAASERMCRPLVAAVTSASHAELRAATAEQGFEPPADEAQRPRSRGSLGRDRAMAVGSAVHALLEGWDLTAEPDEELARQRSRLPTVLAALGFGEDDAAACSEAEAIVDGFARSELFARFTSLGDRLVARELPVWLAPQADLGSGEAGTPLECISGVIDLVYRDQDGRLVVVDYKTDRLASQDELAARATRYAPQGETYLRAITDGLTLAEVPRFELWFVRDGSIATPLD